MSKYFVFASIDTDKQPSVAQAFGANALPTIKMIKADGTVVGGFIGYKPLGAVLAEMNAARQNGG
jgi:thioredoxin-like negative regulator of GroEL